MLKAPSLKSSAAWRFSETNLRGGEEMDLKRPFGTSLVFLVIGAMNRLWDGHLSILSINKHAIIPLHSAPLPITNHIQTESRNPPWAIPGVPRFPVHGTSNMHGRISSDLGSHSSPIWGSHLNSLQRQGKAQ